MIIFIAYSREDKDLLKDLLSNLKLFERKKLIDQIWYDGLIDAGSKWEDEIMSQLKSSEIILLLISANFINSDYAYSVEMEEALSLEEKGKARVIPILLRHCAWKLTDISHLQILPRNSHPIDSRYWHSKDEAFASIMESLSDILLNKDTEEFPELDLAESVDQEKDNKSNINSNNSIFISSKLFNNLKQVIVTKLGVEESEVTLDSRFREDLGADSLDELELVMEIEKIYNLSISDQQVENFKSVSDVMLYLHENGIS